MPSSSARVYHDSDERTHAGRKNMICSHDSSHKASVFNKYIQIHTCELLVPASRPRLMSKSYHTKCGYAFDPFHFIFLWKLILFSKLQGGGGPYMLIYKFIEVNKFLCLDVPGEIVKEMVRRLAKVVIWKPGLWWQGSMFWCLMPFL